MEELKQLIVTYADNVLIGGLAGLIAGYIVSAVSGSKNLGKIAGVFIAGVVFILTV